MPMRLALMGGEEFSEERHQLEQMLAEYQRIVLVRAQAAVLLKLRGYDLSDPKVLNEPGPTYS